MSRLEETSRRRATHAGSWYPSDGGQLRDTVFKHRGQGPRAGARVVVAPHAGYKYCSSVLWPAYESLDTSCPGSSHLRVFVLGPSHHAYFKDTFLVSGYSELDTPLGPLPVDTEYCESLVQGGGPFKRMSEAVDLAEHSLEMQYPALRCLLEQRGLSSGARGAQVVPIMVSHASREKYASLAAVLAEQLASQRAIVVVSSDFCHWGRRFEYTGYVGSQEELTTALAEETEVEELTARSKLAHHRLPIWQSVELLDRGAMHVLESNDLDKWTEYLAITGNTVCGRNPLCVLLLALQQHRGGAPHWEWVKYAQSSKVQDITQSSVSYASAYIKLPSV
ncbi:Mho1p KNAG_0M01400 [Huiozyma naganishii CBS 8797]|uniref:AmmeMemoRadiSam system protein B n=1 Tax=Huiozyma naganishii (strain ATCC MYA-139 / BCRC 22969 / CBS 8797 / KCTC 17520 / NBRC 10181 / NCYC 3082 / Yp74L-3) TaxID=1071383 RepID=J7RSV9_HUIN7|nr:hypothetical protein KNAG_0M01400 [Kazachstania naganishii CBS 8797]CCK72993.1 hypothetical protein KNAG_0M01400 [Kazachstania naganishii CBS 8797]